MSTEVSTASQLNVIVEGNPAALGLPVFVAGSIALGLGLLGYVPGDASGAPLSIIAAGTGIGLTIATIWAAAIGQSAVASIFGIFAGFWLSYALLVFGLLHGWLAIAENGAVRAQALFLITWLIVIVLLTIGTLNGSSGWLKLGGILSLLFAAVGAWVYVGVISVATGGQSTNLGRPVLGD